jgi:hypothetical protein
MADDSVPHVSAFGMDKKYQWTHLILQYKFPNFAKPSQGVLVGGCVYSYSVCVCKLPRSNVIVFGVYGKRPGLA